MPSDGHVTFRSEDLTAERYVWDAEAHLAHGERCRYILLRLQAPQLDVIGRLAEVMDKALIVSYCTYFIYGYYDILIRIWSTPQKLERLSRLLQRTFDIAAQRDFEVDRIKYLWAEDKGTKETAERNRPTIDNVSMEEMAGHLTISNADLILVRDAGLLHHLPAEYSDSIKLYVTLSRLPDAGPGMNDFDTLSGYLREVSPKALRNVSLYQCNSGADFLIKMVLENFRDVLRTVGDVAKFAEQMQLRPMTLLIGNTDAPEIDAIDTRWEDFPNSVFRLENILSPLSSSIAKDLANLPKQERYEIADRFERHEPTRQQFTAFVAQFDGLFLARIEKNAQLFAEKASWVTHLESLHRRYWTDLWIAQLGTQWHPKVKEVAGSIGISSDPKKLSLRDTVALAAKLLSSNVVGTAMPMRQLGEDWEQRLRGLTEPVGFIHDSRGLRNDLMHGSFYDDLDEFWAHSMHVVDALLDAAQVYRRLREHFGE